MISNSTMAGLQDTLKDLEKQMDKAKEKYDMLYRRVTAIRAAIDVLK